MARYWVYIDERVLGPLEIPQLRKVAGFTLLTQVCADGHDAWQMADQVIEIKAYFLSPPRMASLVDTEPLSQEAVNPEPIVLKAATSLIEELPPAQEESLLEKSSIAEETIESLSDAKPLGETSPAAPALGSDAATPVSGSRELRWACQTCGYKNPRDVGLCMKCGEKHIEAPAAAPTSAAIEPPIASLKFTGAMSPNTMTETPPPLEVETLPRIDIPVGRILGIVVAVAVLCGAVFVGNRTAKQKGWWPYKSKTKKPVAESVTPAEPPQEKVKGTTKKKPTASSHGHPAAVVKETSPEEMPSQPTKAVSKPPVRKSVKAQKTASVVSAIPEDADAETPRIVEEAYPLKQRASSPVDSPYAQKRRGNKTLWTNRENDAISLVQKKRLYGGQRTLKRNVEILMQILRDKEYMAAYETGTRQYYYNIASWKATPKEGTVYEVQLTFSGGKDGTQSREPLRFTFDADLERGTVQPGGSEASAANGRYAFFDMGRIPPETRRDAAKDTEELVLAAQPGVTALQLQPIARGYVKKHSYETLARVARAYNLKNVERVLGDQAPDPSKGKEGLDSRSAPSAAVTDMLETNETPKVQEVSLEVAKPAKPAKSEKMKVGKRENVDYVMEKGTKGERSVRIQMPTTSGEGALYESAVNFDRFSQYVPDVLLSQKEGQDGNASVVHTIFLTRFMFFVFKVNLHLRVTEHPKEKLIEFERIAGDFDQLRGSVRIITGSDGKATMAFQTRLDPKSRIPEWILRGIVKRFLLPAITAVCNRAEEISA